MRSLVVLWMTTLRFFFSEVDTYGKDDHPWGWVVWYNRQCEGKDPGQRRYSSGSTTTNFCWKAAWRWAYAFRLQYPKGIDSSSGTFVQQEKIHRKNDKHFCTFWVWNCLVLLWRFFVYVEEQKAVSRRVRRSSRRSAVSVTPTRMAVVPSRDRIYTDSSEGNQGRSKVFRTLQLTRTLESHGVTRRCSNTFRIQRRWSQEQRWCLPDWRRRRSATIWSLSSRRSPTSRTFSTNNFSQ